MYPTAAKPDKAYEKVTCTTCNVDHLGGIAGCPQCGGSGQIMHSTAATLAKQRRDWWLIAP